MAVNRQLVRSFVRLALAFALGCTVGAYGLSVYQDLYVPLSQIRNFANMQAWQAVLSDINDRTGEYPPTLEAALDDWISRQDEPPDAEEASQRLLDRWGNPFHYARLEGDYILASFGRDGTCDYRDLFVYRERPNLDRSPCYSPKRDTVLRASGLVKGCSK